MKNTKNILIKTNNGITLIALVITIIVLLILAAVSIATLTGQNGILTRANDAKEQTEIASVKEQAQLDIANWTAERLKNGENTTLNDATVKTILETANADNENPYYKELQTDKIITPSGYEILYSELYTKTEVGNDNIKEYTEDGVPIPKGFYYVGGTKDTGVIISDNPDDPNVESADKTSHEAATKMKGNQFVWIPVDKETFDTKFKRQEGYGYGSQENRLVNCGEADGTGVNDKVTETTITQTEAKEMYKSVKTNGGFYIGRFEAGNKDNKVVVQKNVNPYTDIQWSANGKMQETNGTTGGAVELARNFDTANHYTSITSTLIYGVQWDAVMNFIDSNYITNAEIGLPNCLEDSYVRDSSGKGNYDEDKNTNSWKGDIAKTGAISKYSKKNIYDLAGNVAEWTMESKGIDCRLTRGGDCYYDGFGHPVSSSFDWDVDNGQNCIGFRITLYL